MRLTILATATLLCAVSAAPAAIVGEFVPVTSEGGTSPPSGFVTQDLVVQTDTDWFGANLLIELTAGSIYQNELQSGYGPPSPGFFPIVPDLRWDTYVTGSLGVNGPAPSSLGGAVDLGGSAAGQFDTAGIDLNWFTVTTNDIGTFSLGRFTLSNDAVGTFKLRLDAAAEANLLLRNGPAVNVVLEGTIEGGRFVAVPELHSIGLIGAAGLLLAVGRRKWASLGR